MSFPEWSLTQEINPSIFGDSAAEYRSFEIRPGRLERYLAIGHKFYELPNRQLRILKFSDPRYPDRGYEVALVSPRCQRSQAESEFEALRLWMKRNHYLKNQAIRADATLLPDIGCVTWNDVAVADEIWQTLIDNTVGILRRQAAYAHVGIPLKRGILLHGQPGTGKTMIGKALAGLGIATFIYATAGDVNCSEGVSNLFQLARKLAPTILLLEDMDLFAEDRRGRVRDTVLGEMLTQMDGLEENNGLIVIGTTNDLGAIEPALKDRPSRFDVILEIGVPAIAERRRILQINLKGTNIGEVAIEEAARATQGLTGAQIREVAFQALQQAVLDSEDQIPPRLPVVKTEDLIQASYRVSGNHSCKLGFETQPH